MGDRKRILITGAGGRIGQSLAEQLGPRYDLRLLYHRTVPEPHRGAAARAERSGRPEKILGTPHEVYLADLSSTADLDAGFRDVGAVVHLAADARVSAPWESILSANITGTYRVFESARHAGAGKVVFASSNHATGFYERERRYTTPAMPVRPDSMYGVSKCFGEALGRYYSDAHGLSVICLRIGSFQPQPQDERQLATWLSPRDMAQLTWRSIETDLPFGVFYGISGNTRASWDIGNARRQLGYIPADDAERFAAQILAAG